jgi:hypothetical protein
MFDQHQGSPFLLEGEIQQQKQQQQPEPQATPERNKGRNLRRAGNACEIAAGASLNSAIVFLFHFMQVHPIGLILALGVSHAYFTATAWGEGQDRFVANVMTGCSAGLAAVCSLSEPIGEWLEARESRSTAVSDLQTIYTAAEQPQIISTGWILILGVVLTLGIAAIGGGGKKR